MVSEFGLIGVLGVIYSPFVDLKVHGGLFGLFDSPRVGMGPHLREGVKRYDIHIKSKSYNYLSF